MSRSGPSQQVARGAAVVHDLALLVAVFYAPIFWGGFKASGQAFVSGAVGLAALAALVARWAQGQGPARIPNAIHVPAVALLGVSALSAIFSVSGHASGLEVSRLAVGVLAFWLVANRALLPAARPELVAAGFGCSVVLTAFIPVGGEAGLVLKLFAVIGMGMTCAVIASEREERDPVRWWLGALVLAGALVVALYGVREKIAVWRLLDNPTWQIFSTFFNPNPLGGFLAMVFPLAASAALAAALLWRRLLWGFCALLLAGTLLPTYSKGAMVAFAVSVGVYVVLIGWQNARLRVSVAGALAVLTVGLVGIGLAVLVLQPVRARAGAALNAQSASNMFRILTWKGTVKLASAHPWLGVGPGGFKHAYPKYATAGYVEAAHQNYLQVFAEQGVFGGAIFLWLMGAVLFTGKRALARAGDFRGRALAIGGLCSVIALLVHSLLDYDWYIGAIGFIFWVVAGMLAHQAHGREVVAAEPVEDVPQGRRRGRGSSRSQAAGGGSGAGSESARAAEAGVRRLPWPRSGGGRGAMIAGAALVLTIWVWDLTNTALAAQAVERGNTALMSRQTATALRLYEDATRYDPGLADAWERYGLLRAMLAVDEERRDVRERGIEEGKNAMKRAIELEPESFRPLRGLAEFYRRTGAFEEAVDYYLLALEKFPKNTKTLRRLGEVYQSLGDEERALQVYQQMIQIEDSPFNKYRALAVDVDTEFGYAHYQLGRLALRDHEAGGRPEGLEGALSEFGESLRVIGDYFERAEETDRMFLTLLRPREYRGEAMRQLGAKVSWRMGEVHELMGDAARAERERERAREQWGQVEESIKAEDEGRAE